MNEDRKKRAPDVPKLNKNTTVAKWDKTSCIHTSENVTDVMTKPLSGEKRKKFVRMLLHYICEDVAWSVRSTGWGGVGQVFDAFLLPVLVID